MAKSSHQHNKTFYEALLNGPYRLTNLKTMEGCEGQAWSATINKNGKKIGSCRDDGNGGMLWIELPPAERTAFRAWCATLPPVPRIFDWQKDDDPLWQTARDETVLAELSVFHELARKKGIVALVDGEWSTFKQGVQAEAIQKKWPTAWIPPAKLLKEAPQ